MRLHDFFDSKIDEHIVKVKGGYRLVSKHGGKNLGTYPTRAGAEKRERQVQYFKHANESVNKSFVITAKTAEGDTKKYRVKAQSDRVAREKFAKHYAMAKVLDVKEG